MTTRKKNTRPKRKVRGKDWHAWALKHTPTGEFYYFATYDRQQSFGHYRAVRVKFVEVKP